MIMNKILNEEQLEERARDHTIEGGNVPEYNGIERVLVTLEIAPTPGFAWLDVTFYNDLIALTEIIGHITTNSKLPTDIFKISGGSRIKGGEGFGQIRVTEILAGSENNILRLRVEPVGDYSTYTLALDTGDYDIDPIFSIINFKFRPGCFNTNCAPISNYEAASDEPVIDYLARDFDSFKHVLINAMRERVPNWQPTSEADLDQVLIDLIAADADELCDYQDRVMNEAYLGRSRKRVSLARYARLMDYHIHQGNQASTWLAVQVNGDLTVNRGFGVWTTDNWQDEKAIIFITVHDKPCSKALNELHLYDWGNVVTALEAGVTEADLGSMITKGEADDLTQQFQSDDVTHILIEQKLNPETGTENGVDKTARQVLQLLEGATAAESVHDPINNTWFVRVHWREEDKLKRRYCFITECPGEPVQTGVSAFHGNLIRITNGRPHTTTFRPNGEELAAGVDSQFIRTDEAYYEESLWGVICPLPQILLAYQNTEPGGEIPPHSTLKVEVNGFVEPWQEQVDLVGSESDDQHFIVETSEMDTSAIRFGNNINGRALPQNAVVICYYQIGRGSKGNIGADTLDGFDNSVTGFPDVEKVWNPLDVTDGRDPEPQEEIIRRVPHAYLTRQLRAVTLEDYAKRAEELDDVSHAYARYAWTGSWRTVRVSIDPKGTDEFSKELREKIAVHLDAVRLIGEDLEVRGAQYVALDILLRVCAHPDYWPEDLAHELEVEFSDGYTADGRMGFFHSDLWTFGQPLHASQIIGRALAVKGLERVLLLSIRRWNAGSGPSTTTITISPEDLPENEIDTLELKPFELIQVANDPDHLEKGRIHFDILGGRR